MAEDTFANKMVTKFECLLEDNVGVQSVTVDGVAVSYADLLVQYEYWKKRQAVARGTRPRVSSINLSGF
jgi:hypothetical protein